ncbi:MAG: zinc-ribbon domain-containing protein, partial [Alphaproteobacteria bacterium]|nr:zinc-ribbon domain-containing protein [Alphaproteobacteria bacterium]
SNQILILGRNDLATTHPNLAAEWHPTKNGAATPQNTITGNGRKYWWICTKCNNEWQATIVHRKFSNSGCPHCYKNQKKKRA